MDKFQSKYRFLTRSRGAFGTDEVVVIHNPNLANESRIIVEGHIQPELGFFELDSPIYEGDWVEVEDARGGTRTLLAAEVNQFKGRSSIMSHTEVKWGRPTVSGAALSSNVGQNVYHAPVVIVNGDQAQVAWDGGIANRTDAIPQEFAHLAASVTQALELLSREGAVASDDAELADEVGRGILEELTKPAPEPKKIRAGLATLRGILTTVSGAAGSGLASGTIEELVKQLVAP